MLGVVQATMEIRRTDEDQTTRSTPAPASASARLTDTGTGARSRFNERGLAEPLALTPGWEWALVPQPCSYSSMATRGMVIRIDKDDTAFRLTLAYPQSWGAGEYAKYRPAAFDADGKRYEFEKNGSSASGNVGLAVFKLAPEAPIDGITYLGIERLTPERFKVVSELMTRPAREAGLEPLPIPVDGQPYTFSITTTDDRTLRSDDLRGKVVLIDCWATWCMPCMVKMPKLKEL